MLAAHLRGNGTRAAGGPGRRRGAGPAFARTGGDPRSAPDAPVAVGREPHVPLLHLAGGSVFTLAIECIHRMFRKMSLFALQ